MQAALAAAGLFGLASPPAAGGLDVDLATFCNVIEIMPSGCLATTFVWLPRIWSAASLDLELASARNRLDAADTVSMPAAGGPSRPNWHSALRAPSPRA